MARLWRRGYISGRVSLRVEMGSTVNSIRDLSGGDENVCTHGTFTKNHWILHLKWVNVMDYKLSSSK